jgi:hypothetical protein
MLLNFVLTELLLWELGYPDQVMSGSSTLRGDLGASCSLVLCVWPLCSSGGSGGRRVPLALAGRYQ